MTHGLVVRRGRLGTLCNGRPAVNRFGKVVNGVKDDHLSQLIDAIKSTEGTSRRVLIPQEALKDQVSCKKCSCLMDAKARTKYMERIYTKSRTYQNRKQRNSQRGQLESFTGKSEEKSPLRLEFPPGKTCVMTINFV